MKHYKDRSFHATRQGISNESVLWNHIQQVCRREEDIGRRLSSSAQLQEFVAKPSSKALISRNLDQALNSLLDVFFERNVDELQRRVTNILANIAITLSYDAYPFFQWLVRQFQGIANDTVRNFLLKSLTELLRKDLQYRYYGKMMGLVLSELQALLESVDIPEHLPVCIDPLLLISKSYPEVFFKHFRDIVDILVGWHIDHSQDISLIIFCANALQSLQPHWQNDLDFSLTLLNQFLEDMEAYAEGIDKLQETVELAENPESLLMKTAALLRAFSTVVRSIGSAFHADETGAINESFVLELLQRIIVCAQLVGDLSFTATCAANECMQLLIAAIHWKREEMLSESLLTYVVHGVERSESESRLVLALKLVIVMVQEIGSALPAWFVVGLLGPSSRLLPLKYGRNPEITSELLSLYQACLSVRNVSLLQTAYRNVIGELQYALNQLLKKLDPEAESIQIIKDDPFGEVNAHSTFSGSSKNSKSQRNCVEFMLKTALFDVTALSEVADAKNSIIGMFALSPSIFDLLHTELEIVHDGLLSSRYPQIQYIVICTLYSHCQRHKHFLSTYLGGSVPQSPVPSSTGASTVANITHGHYPQILTLISRLLMKKGISPMSRNLLLHWSEDLINTLLKFKEAWHVVTERNFLNLLKSLSIAGTHMTDKTSTIVKCFTNVFTMLETREISDIDDSEVYAIGLPFIMAHIFSMDSEMQTSCFMLLENIPVSQIERYCDTTSWHGSLSQFLKMSQESKNVGNVVTHQKKFHRHNGNRTTQPLNILDAKHHWLAKRSHMLKILTQENTFYSHHFQSMMQILLNGFTFTDLSSTLERIFWSCQHSGLEPTSCKETSIHRSYSFVYWWGLWECALFTVSNKLRTPFGRPQDTFQKIEGALRDYDQQRSSPQLLLPSRKSSVTSAADLEKISFQSEIQCVMQRPHLLLQFLFSLEKLMFNAYCGCVSIAAPNKAVRTFFSTNRSTCEQWLNRLRLAAMKVSLNCGLYCEAINHGQKILQDMKINNNTQGSEFEQAIFMSVEALMELRSPQIIAGLYKWCREISKSQSPNLSTTAIKQVWSWMKPAKNQASSRYEDAAREYQSIYNNLNQKDEESSVSHSGAKRLFVVKQISSCYCALGNWSLASKWIKKYDEFATDSEKEIPYLEYVEALSSFEDGNLKKAEENRNKFLSGIANLDKHTTGGTTSKDGLHTWRSSILTMSSDMHIMKFLITRDDDTRSDVINKVKLVSEAAIKLSSNHWPINIDTNFLSLFAISNWIESGKFSPPPSQIFKNSKWFPGGRRLLEFIRSDYIEEKNVLNDEVFFGYALSACKMHRKLGNFDTCTKLFEHIINKTKTGTENGNVEFKDLNTVVEMCKNLKSSSTTTSHIWDIQFELSKELIAVGNKIPGICLMADTLLECLHDAQSGVKCARILLSFVKSLQSEWKSVSPTLQQFISSSDTESTNELISKFQLLVNHEKLNPWFKSLSSNEQLISEANAEILLGTLVNAATIQNPDLAKAWFHSAGWCYKWGRKIVDTASNSGNVELTEEEKQQVKQILEAHDCDEEKLKQIYEILGQAHWTIANQQDDDILAQQEDARNDNSEIVKKQLQTCCNNWLQQVPEQAIDLLLNVWQKVCARPFTLYHVAADGYFKFLRLNLTQQAKILHEDSTVTTTLRLLRLLAKHALELQATLENGLKETPTTPWNGIIPQLFSRLNHPEVYVRQSISDLLCRIAKNAAHLVVYPVVVATTHADNKSRNLLRSTQLDEDGNQLDGEEDGSGVQFDSGLKSDIASQPSAIEIHAEGYVNACYQNVLEALKSQNEGMVRDVRLLVWELCRITLLWDELWLGTLNQHHQDIMRRLHQLHDEAKRVNSNHSLSKDEKNAILKEQQQAVMRPIVYALRRVQRITNAAPETPHEQWFAENMQPIIDQAMTRLTDPPNPQNPNSCWSGFKQLHFQLSTRASKRTSQILNLGQISPKLMGLNATSMPIPGVSIGGNQVTIQGCSSVVSILPTKTKPKKLQFIGSNCQRFTFLFKGLEDLHLDERIMQFLFIANQLLRRQHKSSGYAARHYSVTPLGSRSGLIQWVDGATPLFTLYKKWQQRQALQAAAQSESGIAKPILRPSVVYYNKLNPALKKGGVDIDKVSRKDWPNNIMRDVLNELISDTPPDLLQRELWCTSTSATKLWDVQQKYSCSTAVMSMIGYVIGLGDRHLDNVLIDLESGEVVHIDYNVCFDKGTQLRVPEKVPFRLTQNVKCALGLTSVEGVFRYVCEQVISTLRKGRETLLTLLEAFVYDPLVDWTGTIEGGYAGAVYGGGGQGDAMPMTKLTRHDMEREISKSLFSSRIAEMKQGWLENRDEMEKALSNSVDELQRYKKHFAAHGDINEKIKNLLEMKVQVKTASTNAQHPLRSLKQRWSQHEIQQSKKESALKTLHEKMTMCDSNIQKYKSFLAMLQTPELAGLLAEVTCPLQLGEPIYQSATSFLNGAGQAAMVNQAQATEKDLVSLSEQCRLAQSSCIEMLTTFAAIVAQFPPTAVITNHSDSIWGSHLSQLASNFSEEECNSVQNIVKKQLSRESKLSQARLASAKDTMLQQEVADLNKLLMKLLERRNSQLTTPAQEWANLENAVAVTRDCIISFVQENGILGMHTILSILTLALIALAQRGITMETTAASAGHRLVDMTSQDGDWFLEELCSLFGNVVQLLHVGDQILTMTEVGHSVNIEAVQALLTVDSCFRSLMDLYNNFRNIILPEAVKLLQCEEPSVIEMVNEFNLILQREKLDDLAKQLTAGLRSSESNSSTSQSCSEALAVVEKMQTQYSLLLHDARQEERRLLAGQMLLQGFDGLFRTAHARFMDLIIVHNNLMDNMQFPEWIKYVDVLQNPDVLQKIKNMPSVKKTMLQALLFVKQMQSMHDFFVLCQSNARSFVIERNTGASGSHYTSSKTLYSEERLMKPVKHFIAHFVQDLMIGIPTQILGLVLCSYVTTLGVDIDAQINSTMRGNPIVIENVCKSLIDEKYTQTVLNKQKMLIYQFNKSWKDLDKAQRLEANITAVRASLQRSKLQHTRFQWLHEDILMESSSVKFNLPQRLDVLLDLNKRMNAMQQLERLLQQIQETATSQNKSILQRLKWAAGANPSLQGVLQEVEKSMQNRNAIMKAETTLSQKVAEFCQTAVEFEESRIQVKESKTDNSFARQCMDALKLCLDTSKEMSNRKVKISNLEATLVKVVTENEKSNILSDDWIIKAVDILQLRAVHLRQVRQQEEGKMQSVKNKVTNIANSIKQLLVTQSRLLSDVKSLLKSLAKDEKSEDPSSSGSVANVRQFLDDYKTFCGKLTDVLNSLLQSCESGTMPDPDPLIQRLTETSQSVSWIYFRLLSLGAPASEDKDMSFMSSPFNKNGNKPSKLKLDYEQTDEKQSSESILKIETTTASSKTAVKKKQDPRTGKVIQERNCFAVSVWRQVKAKLDGRDVDFSRRMQISEQVDYVINEATSVDNLALMYEGWTAWV
ncbi:serine/threonine-protein kinase SMG1-like isoform X1 [Styela clava]